MINETTSPELLESLRDPQNAKAWETFLSLYRPGIEAHCRRSGLTLAETEEVVQECFIKCFRYLPDFDYSRTVGRFRAWLNLLVNQQMVQLSRRRCKDERARDAWRRLVWDAVPNTTKSPADVSDFDAEMMAIAFRRIQGDVSPRDWQIFEAFQIHGFSAAELSSRFALSTGAIRVVVHRIRRKVRHEWKRLSDAPF